MTHIRVGMAHVHAAKVQPPNSTNDCMSDVVTQDYGWAANTTGLAVVFTGYDVFAVRCLVQTNDPRIQFEPVGATAVGWNDTEAARIQTATGVARLTHVLR